MKQSSELKNLAIEYAACQESPAYFLANYAQISDPQLGVTPFALWPFQVDLLDTWQANQRVVVLKARQLGVSWLVAGYALWTALFHEAANVLMISKRLDEAVALLDKCEFIYDRLPQWLQASIAKKNETVLAFAKRGSKITAFPSTEDAGRGESASLVVVDEAAFQPYAETNYAAYKPTVDAGGKLVLVSTANGRGNFYHNVWTGAPANGFAPVFLSWTLRPGRDEAWWGRQVAEYAATPHLLAQEYPANAAEAFISSGHCLFNTEAIAQNLSQCRAPLETRDNGQLLIWQRPIVGRQYVLGADVAEGLDAGNGRLDASHAAVYDAQTGVHVASLHCQLPPDAFAAQVRGLALDYQTAFVGVERNNHGHVVLLVLRQLGYPNLYWHDEGSETVRDKQRPRRVLGWPTNVKTKPILEKNFAAAIAAGAVTSYDAALWDECLSYVQHGDGRAGAQQGCHDDRVLAHMIAWQMRQAQPAAAYLPLSVNARYAS